MEKSVSNTIFEDQLKTLKLQYAQTFPEKIREIERCWQESQQRNGDQFAALAANAHKLAGSSGCFGFQEISRHARILCDLLDLASASKETGLPETRVQIGRQTERLCAALGNP